MFHLTYNFLKFYGEIFFSMNYFVFFFFVNQCATTWAYSVKFVFRMHSIVEICLYFQVLLASFLVLLFFLGDY